MQAFNRLGVLAFNFNDTSFEIVDHTSANALSIIPIFLTRCLLLPIAILICFHKFTIGDRSGDCAGQWSLLTFCLSRYTLTIFAVCHGALSSCITTSGPYFLTTRW